MQHYKELHLATGLEALNRIALKNSQNTTQVKKPAGLMNLAKKLYSKSQSDPFDEEMTYILLCRFLVVYDHLLVIHNDTNFVNMILGKEANRAKAQINDLKNNLINRYEEAALKAAAVEPTPAASPDLIEERTIVFNNTLFITCSELFRAFSNKNINVLVMDARGPQDFKESHIKDVKCISIPESCIVSGLSAHKLGLTLPTDSLEQWDKRDSFDVIVLMDWNTSRTNFTASKLDKLRIILTEWDIGRTYNEKPVVLDCGYIEWLEMYPMLCTSPDVKYSKANTELDELLNLDSIEYPTDSESKSHDVFNQELAKEVTTKMEENTSREQLLREEKQVIEKNKEIAIELLKREQHWRSLYDQINSEYDITKLEQLKREEKEAQEVITKLSQEEADLMAKKSKLASDFNLSVSFEPTESHPEDADNLKDISQLQQEHLDIVKAREALIKDRQHLLDKARQAKKPKGGSKPYKKPSVNRALKPKANFAKYISHMDGKLEAVNYGLTGLTNIKNTCYMNVTIQCLRHVPELIRFFCAGEFTNHIHRPPVITNEVAHLIRCLWSNSYSVIRPTEFYKQFTHMAPIYKMGYHEDCMEFFLQLFTYLSEDSAFEIASKNYWSETQMAWYKQHSGKVSFYINTFYHQIRIQQTCNDCHITNLKFDIENVFYLTVPDNTFSLEECMYAYLHNVERFACKKCKKPKEVKKTISCYPRILAIALKRHIQDYVQRNTSYYKKNKHECYFPTDNFVVGTCTYELNAVALHSGNLQAGHYTAACLNPMNNRWYLFNDEEVSPIEITDPKIRTQAYAFYYSLKKESIYNNNTMDGLKIFEEKGVKRVSELE